MSQKFWEIASDLLFYSACQHYLRAFYILYVGINYNKNNDTKVSHSKSYMKLKGILKKYFTWHSS